MTTRLGLADRNIQFFVLLLCPSRLYIDLVAITVDELALRDDSTIWDVLESIQRKCAEKRLLENRYVGFVRISDQVIFTDLDARAFRKVVADEGGDLLSRGGQEYIEEHDVLVAVLEGHSAHGMIELAEPVLQNPDFAEAIGQSFVWRLMPKATTGRTSRGHDIHGDASRKSTTNNFPDGQDETADVDYLDESESRGLTLGHQKYSDEEPSDGGARAGRGIFEPIADYLGNTIDFAPTFNSRGKFTHHESRGMLDQDAQSATSSSVLSGRSAAEELWDIQDQIDEMAPHRSTRVSRRAVMFTLLMLFVAISAIFLAGLTKQVSISTSEEQLVGKPVQNEGAGATAAPHVAENAPRPTKRPVSSSNFSVLADTHTKSSTESTSTPTNSPTPPSPFTQAHVGTRTESPSRTKQQTHPSAKSATAIPTETPVRTQNTLSDGILTGKTENNKHSGSQSSTPTPKPTHKRHNDSDRLPTGKPSHKKHDHDARQSSAPTPKPTHKRHNHSDRLPTGKPTHKKHDHDARQSSVPTPKPTHKRHNHSDRLPTGKPTHKKHNHDARQSSTPTPKPTHKKHDHDVRQSSAPTPKPTHKRHNHPDRLPTGEPTHEKHDHSDGHNSTSALPETHVDDAQASATASDPIHIKPRGLATVDKSNPDFKFGGLEQLGVERDESVSFLHFSLASIAGAAVASATLNLYLTTYEDDDIGDESEVAFTVDMLPHAGDWSVGSVSWNEPPDSEEPFPVDYLMVDYVMVQSLASASSEEELYAVRVTSAIVRAHQLEHPSVTFRLSTESGGRLSFASKQWSGGELMPELVVTLEE